MQSYISSVCFSGGYSVLYCHVNWVYCDIYFSQSLCLKVISTLIRIRKYLSNRVQYTVKKSKVDTKFKFKATIFRGFLCFLNLYSVYSTKHKNLLKLV